MTCQTLNLNFALLEFRDHVLDAWNGFQLVRVRRLEILHKAALAQAPEDREVIHLVTGWA